jgi:hypothetical protein
VEALGSAFLPVLERKAKPVLPGRQRHQPWRQQSRISL